MRPVSGGALLQETDLINAPGDSSAAWVQVCGEKVSDEVMKDLGFAWKSVRAVKSNAILLSKNGASVGIG